MESSLRNQKINTPEDFLKKYLEYAQLKISCKFTGIEPFKEEMGYRWEGEEGVTHHEEKKGHFTITVDAVAHSCFDDFEIELYFTFGEDREAWESRQKYFNTLIKKFGNTSFNIS